ncbi:MAG TPA: leucine-rich repeat domain-containing protein, partial [Blastocatellia bacterium]|nr:leucine-rich repeat domain-containing protein [Blastocatellia bacterium]
MRWLETITERLLDPWEAERALALMHQSAPDLKTLDLSGRALSEVPLGLARFENLETLDLSHNQLLDLGFPML